MESSTLFGLQSRLGDKLLGNRVDFPQNGTAVLKGSRAEQVITSVAVCGVVPVASIVPALMFGLRMIHAL